MFDFKQPTTFAAMPDQDQSQSGSEDDSSGSDDPDLG
jgi:hypothetical protein